MELEEAKKIFKESIDEAETPIDLFRIIFEKTYEKGVEDGKTKQEWISQYGQRSLIYDSLYRMQLLQEEKMVQIVWHQKR